MRWAGEPVEDAIGLRGIADLFVPARPGEDANPLHGISFPGATLPCALSRILYAGSKIGNTVGRNIRPAVR
jgi:hypothetical protein